MANDLNLALKIKAAVDGLGEVNKLSKEISDLGGDATALVDEASKLGKELNNLTNQQELVDRFKKTKEQVTATDKALADARQRTAELGREFNSTENPTKKLTNEFERAKKEVRLLAEQSQKQRLALQDSRKEMDAAGISSTNLANTQLEVKKRLAETTSAIEKLKVGATATKGVATDLAENIKSIAAAREKLNLISHDKIRDEIAQVRKAYGDLKASGTATHAELAQAAMKMEQHIAQLKDETGGWVEAMGEAKSSVAALAASAAGLTVSAKAAMSFETAMADVAKVVQATPEEMSALTDEIKSMAREIPLTVEALAAIAAQAGQLGIAGSDIREFTELVAQMATAFGMAPEAAAQSIATLKTIFGLGMDEIRALGDAINVLGNNTSARERDIVEVMARIGGSAKQFGLATEQTAALSAAMLSLGRSPDVASTAINALISKMQTAGIAGNEFQEALGRIGMTGEQLAASVRDNPQKALTDFLRTLQGLESQTRAEVIGKLFGLEYQDDIALLVGSLDAYGNALGLVADKQTYMGAMLEEFKTRLGTSEAQWQIMLSSVREFAINLGTVFLPAVNAVARGISSASQAMSDFVQAYPAIAGAAAVIGTVIASAAALKITLAALRMAGASTFGQMADMANTFSGLLTKAHAEIGKTASAMRAMAGVTGVLAAAYAGYQIGTWMYEQSSIVRKAGVLIVQTATWIAEQYRYRFEQIKAIVTDDTIAAATERHAKRLAEMKTIFGEMYKDAEQAPKKAGDAAEKSAASAEQAASKIAGSAGAASAEIAKIGDATAKAMDAGKEKTDAFAQALSTLGLDAGKVTTGISSIETTAIAAFDAVVTNAKVSGDGIAAAFLSAIQKVESQQGLDYLSAKIQQLGKDGKLTGDQVSAALIEIDRTARTRTTAGLNAVELAFERLGITSKKALQEAASQAKSDFETIKNSGLASTAQLQQAFAVYAKAVIAANGGVVSTQLEMYALFNGMDGVLKTLGKTGQQSGKDIAGGMDEAAAAAERARRAMQNANNAAGDKPKSNIEVWAVQSTAAVTVLSEELIYLNDNYQRIMDSLADVNNLTPSTIRAAEHAVAAIGNLDDSRLDNLKNSIRAARDELERLSESARNTVDQLRDEVDRLRGNELAIQQREFRRRYAELQEQLEAARIAKNSQAVADLREALMLLQEAYKLETKQSVNVSTRRKGGGAFVGGGETTDITFGPAPQAQQPQSVAPTQSREPAPTPAPSKTVRVEFPTSSGLAVGTFDEADANRLVDMLESAAMRVRA